MLLCKHKKLVRRGINMKKILSKILSIIISIALLPQICIYANKQFQRPVFQNGGIMSVNLDGYSYYYLHEDSESFGGDKNNALTRFDYNSGERLIIAEGVADFITDGKVIYYISFF